MNTSLRLLLKLILVAAVGGTAFAQPINLTHPEQMVASVDGLVSLTREQRKLVTEIINHTVAEILAVPADRRTLDDGSIRNQMRRDIREVLTPAQRIKYDRAPQINGGGLTLALPENKVTRLDQLVRLNADQKAQALKIFTVEFEALFALTEADRLAGGANARKTAREAIRIILNSEQQAKYVEAPQIKGGGSTKPPRS